MAAEGIRIQSAPTAPETKKLTGYEEEEKKKEAEKEELRKEEGKGDSKGAETKPAEKDTGAAAATGVQEPSEKESAAEPKTGEKRERDGTTAPAENGTTDEAADPANKKQKTEESAKAEEPAQADEPSKSREPAKAEDGTSGAAAEKEDTAAAATNGEKKPGRPRKGVKGLAKKVTQRVTDGIGSRTRSRTKAA